MQSRRFALPLLAVGFVISNFLTGCATSKKDAWVDPKTGERMVSVEPALGSHVRRRGTKAEADRERQMRSADTKEALDRIRSQTMRPVPNELDQPVGR